MVICHLKVDSAHFTDIAKESNRYLNKTEMTFVTKMKKSLLNKSMFLF